MASTRKGALFSAEEGRQAGIRDFIGRVLGEGGFDAVLMPARLSTGDSFTYLLIDDESVLERASALPPVMPVQGAKAVSGISALAGDGASIAAFLRPCEARGAVELSKLGQVDLENLTLVTLDCPGALPLAEYLESPTKGDEIFQDGAGNWNGEPMRRVCQTCDRFSATGAEDLHIGTLGQKDEDFLLIPQSSKGDELLDALGISAEADISGWEKDVHDRVEEKKVARSQAQRELEATVQGTDNLLRVFAKCINCRNCMRVCPICYCRQCHFDSEKTKFGFEDYLARAQARGGLRLPADTVLFHIGRMLHMSLSCVSCGTCQDACPMDIPVAEVFGLVGNANQRAFDYVPGRSKDEPIPLATFEQAEFEEVEQSHAGTSAT